MYRILKAEQLADKIFLMDVEAPRVARACQPGEFVIVKIDEKGERIPLDNLRLQPGTGNRYHCIPDCRCFYSENVRIEGRRCLPGFCRTAGTAI